MRKLEKFLTREASLIAIESWYKGRADYFKKIFGFPFSPTVFLHRNGVFEFYTDLKNVEFELPKKLAAWTKKENNATKLDLLYQKATRALSYFRSISKKKIKNNKEALYYLGKVKEQFGQGFFGVYLPHHIPRYQENLSKKGKKLFPPKLVVKLMKWRAAESNIFFNEGIETIYFLLDKIRLRENSGFLKYATFQELRSSINNNKPLPIGEMKKRKSSIFGYFDHQIFFLKDLEKNLKNIGYKLVDEEIITGITKVSGKSAYRGLKIGRARIIFNRGELNSVRKDDILIAPMTSPWYMAGMKKAVAFVTDEGGITCHAAIMSREMKKPCVIGTKVATKIFKDGDMVEVDANKGIVRKI